MPLDAESARAAVARYTSHLVRGEYAAAFAMLGEEARAHWGSAEAFASDRRAFFDSVRGRYVVSVATGSIADWVSATYGAAIDLGRAVLIEVRYPALVGNNAGYSLFIVNPTRTGVALYDVR